MYNGYKIYRILFIFLQNLHFVASHIKIHTEQRQNGYTQYRNDCTLHCNFRVILCFFLF